MSFERCGAGIRERGIRVGISVAAATIVASSFAAAVCDSAAALPERGRAESPAVRGASFTYGFFKTPSGNILCSWTLSPRSASVECVVKSGLKPPPPPRAGCSPTIVVGLHATGRVRTTGSVCPGEDAPETPYVGSGIARVLRYGKTWSGGGIGCTSAVTGLTCRNKSGHGFFLSREKWRAF